MIHLTGYIMKMDAASYDLTGSTDYFGWVTDPQRSACIAAMHLVDRYVASERANCGVRRPTYRNVPAVFLDERSPAMGRRDETLPVQAAAQALRKALRDIDDLGLAEALHDKGKSDIETLTIHGGILWMEESMSYGTTFTFVLPFR